MKMPEGLLSSTRSQGILMKLLTLSYPTMIQGKGRNVEKTRSDDKPELLGGKGRTEKTVAPPLRKRKKISE